MAHMSVGGPAAATETVLSLACLRTIPHQFPRPGAAQDLLRARESERFIFSGKFAAEQDQLQNPAHMF